MKIDQLRIENEAELAKCRPALEEADRAINELTKDNITELKTFVSPPKVVELALRCVFIFLGHNVKADFEWNWAKGIISDIKFLEYLKKYDK
jgi:dynein heavy chain, axonemal